MTFLPDKKRLKILLILRAGIFEPIIKQLYLLDYGKQSNQLDFGKDAIKKTVFENSNFLEYNNDPIITRANKIIQEQRVLLASVFECSNFFLPR